MREVIQTVTEVPLSVLQELLDTVMWTWVYAERQADIVLTGRERFLSGSVPLAQWAHGRVFNRQLELSWWRQEERYDLRWISEGSSPPPESITWTAVDTTAWTAEDQHWLLVGEYDRDREREVPTWSEARIPRYLPYPIEVEEGATPPDRVALVARSYQVQHIPQTTRLLRVEEM
jgi:hypothetical protein